jgi:CubicO group peptidase (beta-lactamase class C family)
MLRLLSGCLLSFASLAAQTSVPPAPLADLADLLAPIRAKHGVPALGAAVIVDGKLTALGVDGVRRAGHDEKVTADDLWHLGSCTKAMTATLLARLVEAGKLQWTTTAAEALPDLAPALNEQARAITLTNLLTHRAGLPGGPPADLWKQLWDWKGSLRDARTEVCKRMLGVAPEAPLGERFFYSNASYIIAGAIAEHAANAAWEDLMRREIFAPLGITSGGFGMPGDKDGTTQPWGHKPDPKGPVAEFGDNPPALGPAGTVHMTLRDWAKFAALHLGEPGPDGNLLLRAETLQALHTPPPKADYACGWAVTERPWAPGPILTHNGSNTMWYCVAWLAPAAKFAVLVTSNEGDASKACDDVAAACIRKFRPAKK